LSQSDSNDVESLPSDDPDRTEATNDLQLSQVLGGRYKVVSRLGGGGMGVVYKVNQIFLNKEFALKTIEKHCMSDIAIRRFQHEARTAFALDHANIIAVNDFGVLDDQTPFLVMELIDGETLGERLKSAVCLKLEDAIPIFVQVCFGLAYAHECGVVHRDIKPNNIMILNKLPIDAEGSVKIVDFGIAKFIEHEGGEIQALTRTGEIFGSPYYMSPEQCIGVKVDHRADVYALGCVLFETLTGTPPFMGDNALSTMMKHQGEVAPTLKEASLGTEFPRGIEEIVATMLAKSPDKRYNNLGILAHDLAALRRGESISPSRGSAATQKPPEETIVSMKRTSFYALLFLIAMLSAGVTWLCGYHLLNRPPEPSSVMTNKRGIKESVPSVPLSSLTSIKLPYDTEPEEISPDELKNKLAQPNSKNIFVFKYNLVSDKSLELISNTQWIHTLILDACIIDNDHLDRLAKMQLSHLDLQDSNFNDDGAAKLSKFSGLVEINAGDTKLTDLGMGQLATIKGLTHLSIYGTQITDKSLLAVVKSKDLVYLDIRRVKKVSNRGLRALEHTNVHLLNLDSTNIDDDGMGYLSKMPKLDRVVLNKTKVTMRGLKELCKSKTILAVDLENCSKLTDDDFRILRSLFPSIHFNKESNFGV
jgi:serine/threonine protein kinase